MKILLTSAGFQGAYNLVKFLQNKGYYVIGTDMNRNSAAKHYCDKFYRILKSIDEKTKLYEPFMEEFFDIVEAEKPDVIIPGSDNDAHVLSFISMGNILVSNGLVKEGKGRVDILRACNNKYHTYKCLEGKIDLPKYIYAHDPCCSSNGYWKKPIVGSGTKGLEFIDGGTEFNRYMVVENLKGVHIDVDVLSLNGELLIAEPKIRQRAYGGTLVEGEIVNRPEIVEQVKEILKHIPLSYLSVFQFIGGKLLEINPRIAGAVIDYNIVEMAIKLKLGTIKPREIKKYKIPYGKKTARGMAELLP